MNSLFPDICSDDVAACKRFYQALFDFETVADLGWYVQLRSRRDPNLQIAFVERSHESVPAGFREQPRGVLVTIEADDVAPLAQRALELGLSHVLHLCDEQWGQRHFIVRDPNGLAVDVVQYIGAPSTAEAPR